MIILSVAILKFSNGKCMYVEVNGMTFALQVEIQCVLSLCLVFATQTFSVQRIADTVFGKLFSYLGFGLCP